MADLQGAVGGGLASAVAVAVLAEIECALISRAVGELLATRVGVWMLRALAVALLSTLTAIVVASGIYALS